MLGHGGARSKGTHVRYSVPQLSVVLHCPEEETELLDEGRVGVCQGQLAWIMCESPPFAEGEDWQLGSGGHSLEVAGRLGRMGPAACPIPVGLGSRYLHASLLLSTDTLLGLCPAWVCLWMCFWLWEFVFSASLSVFCTFEMCVRESMWILGMRSVSLPRLWLCPRPQGPPGPANGAPGAEHGGL